MTPEEAAKKLMVKIGPMFDCDTPWDTQVEQGYSAPTNDAVELIAQAIREAKIEALEEAAKEVEKGFSIHSNPVEVERDHAAQQVSAFQIRLMIARLCPETVPS